MRNYTNSNSVNAIALFYIAPTFLYELFSKKSTIGSKTLIISPNEAA